MNDMCMMKYVEILNSFIHSLSSKMDIHQMSKNGPLASSFETITQIILSVFCKTPLKTIMLRKCLFMHIRSLINNSCESGYKIVYKLHRAAQNDTLSFDISTCKLWCAILLYMKGDCLSTLDIVNQVLSCIPPYAMYFESTINERKQLYVDMFLDYHTTTIQRARRAWMFNLYLDKDMIYSVSLPMGIQIELHFSDNCVMLSPFICAYYLQFLCFHDMHQYDNRDRALSLLTGVAYNFEQNGNPQNAWNLAGHCLLLAEKRDQARVMFNLSYTASQMFPPHDKYNSALWYLQNFYWIQDITNTSVWMFTHTCRLFLSVVTSSFM